MKAWDFDAITYDGGVYCIECCPVPIDFEGVNPIFASSEWDHYPVCDACGMLHEYVGLTEEGQLLSNQ